MIICKVGAFYNLCDERPKFERLVRCLMVENKVYTRNFLILADNHSKILLVKSEAGDTVSVITSQNLTRGNRHESAFVSTDPAIFASLYDQVNDLITNHSVPLHDLFEQKISFK